MTQRIEIRPRDGFGDPHADGTFTHIRELGMTSVTAVRSARLFFLAGELSDADATHIAERLLADPVSETFLAGPTGHGSSGDDTAAVIEVHLQPGVMDPVANSAMQAIRDMGFDIRSVQTGRRYELLGEVSDGDRELIATRLLANPVIEDVFYEAHTPPETEGHDYQLEVVEIPIRDLDDDGLMTLSRDGDLFLDLHEMQAIRDYYRRLGREPRDVELEMIAQTWSEHCIHKTFRSDVKVRNADGEVIEEIPSLIKNTIFTATKKLDKSWCLNVFEDNAGVIEFDADDAVCFKVETHNHPSAIEPYGGASTGIGGVIRDPLGTGLGARPIANTDVFCFGDPSMPLEDVPKGSLHPRRVMRGVVSGVRDYGNRMGIPTVNGAVYFDARYVGNPLVFCGTAAIMPNDKAKKRQPNPGDAIVVVGGRTGRDGIHGATFSSGELTHEHETEFSHAVQIGNAITEKKTLDCLLQAREKGLYSCITDCGAGGLSSAVGEMGETTGATVHLDRVPLKYAGLSYSEIWISEAQERMVLAVPQENVDETLALFAAEDVEATVIGVYGHDDATDKTLKLFYGDTQVGELEMAFLHEGFPRPHKDALWDRVEQPTPAPPAKDNYNETLLKLLGSANIASKEWIIRQYDHEVQGGSVVKPLLGVTEDGPSDAAVVRPKLGSNRGVALACGMNPTLGDLDPYNAALHAIDEALRNIVCVGGDLERTAILDNFCWGNCNKPDRMGSLVQAAKACHDGAMAYGTPFVSGKDSLNNEFQTDDGQTIAIPPTLLISAISIIPDVNWCVTADAKTAGNLLFVVGATQPQLGGSHVLKVEGLGSGNDVPPVDPAANLLVMKAVQKALAAGYVRACHDLSEGGLAVAAAELAFCGGLGVEIDPARLIVTGSTGVSPVSEEHGRDGRDTHGQDGHATSDLARLFGESAGRFLLEVEPDKRDEFLDAIGETPFGEVGVVTDSGRVKIGNFIDVSIADAKAAWQAPFNW